jgi:hypothetical protein
MGRSPCLALFKHLLGIERCAAKGIVSNIEKKRSKQDLPNRDAFRK